jgi:hypothetical protein
MLSKFAVRGGRHTNRRPHHFPAPYNLTPVAIAVQLDNGEEGKSMIPPVKPDVISMCQTDGTLYLLSGRHDVYFGPAVNGAYGRIVTWRDICDNQGSLVDCKFGRRCHRVHANMGMVMTGMGSTNPQVIGPLRADLKAKHRDLFTMGREQLARRKDIDDNYLAEQSAELKELEDEEAVISEAKAREAYLAQRLIDARAKKAQRESALTRQTQQKLIAQEGQPAKKRRLASESTIKPTVQAVDEVNPGLAAAVPTSTVKAEAGAAIAEPEDDTTPQAEVKGDIGEEAETDIAAAEDEPHSTTEDVDADTGDESFIAGNPNAPPGPDDGLVLHEEGI